MTKGISNFKRLQSMLFDEFVQWLNKHSQFDNAPWTIWFNEKYCANCEAVKCKYEEAEEQLGFSPYAHYHGEVDCAYCEINHKCRYFTELEDTPSNEEIIKMWLSQEADE